MADLIQNCCKNATEKLGLNEENEDEENEGDERRNKNKNKTGEDNVAEETFTFISFKTVAGTTTTLVSILEKVKLKFHWNFINNINYNNNFKYNKRCYRFVQ